MKIFGYKFPDKSIIDIEAENEDQSKIELVNLLEEMGYLDCLGEQMKVTKGVESNAN